MSKVYLNAPLLHSTIVAWVVGALILLTSNVFASLSEITYFLTQEKSNISDAQLKKIAIQKEIIPSDFDDDYLEKQIEVNNTIAVWVVLSRKDKLELIDSLKAQFKSDKNIIIEGASDFYVDVMNEVIYDKIAEGTIDKNKTSPVGHLFRLTAMMAGDYDNGESRVKTLQSYLNKEAFEQLLGQYPKMYEHLIKLDEKDGK